MMKLSVLLTFITVSISLLAMTCTLFMTGDFELSVTIGGVVGLIVIIALILLMLSGLRCSKF